MKIRDIYSKKGNFTVSVVIALLCISATAVSLLCPDIHHAMAYAYPIKYPWQTLSGLFLHGSPELTTAGSIGHLIFNLLLVIPFGLMTEKILGSKRFLIMSAVLWIVNAVTFYAIAAAVTPKGETAYGAGISGIAFSYGTIGLYILLVLAKKNIKLLAKQVSFYFLISIGIIMLLMVNPYVAGVSSMIVHITAIISGIIFALIYRNKIQLQPLK